MDNRSLLQSQTMSSSTINLNKGGQKKMARSASINFDDMQDLVLKQEISSQIQLIKIKGISCYSIQQFIQQNDLIIDEKLIKQHSKDCKGQGDVIYEFKIEYLQESWVIRKRWYDYQKIQKFILEEKKVQIPKLEQKNKNEENLKQLEFQFNEMILNQKNLRSCKEIRQFLELSSQRYEKNEKIKQCYMEKRAGGRFTEGCCTRCGILCGKWSNRYFKVTTQGVYYCRNDEKEEIKDQLMFDKNFKVLYGKKDTGIKQGILLKSSHRDLLIRQKDLFFYLDFLVSVQEAASQSEYIINNRYESFAPIREQSQCKWYIDGQGYFQDVCKFIKIAKYEIYITDWWLSPQLHMIRPVTNNMNENRLDQILAQAAQRGVKVKILHWQEHPIAGLANNSLYTKQHLEQLHPNIQVLRHPNYTIPFKWSHHEKMVVVDQAIGFLGGLDLCYGRYDTKEHKIFDYEGDQYNQTTCEWPGIDYCNPRAKDFGNVTKYEEPDIVKEAPRMPWHDIAMRVIGEPVIDMCRHFIQYWNHVNVDNEYKKRTDNILILDTETQESLFQRLQNNIKSKAQDFRTTFQQQGENKSTNELHFQKQKQDEWINDLENQSAQKNQQSQDDRYLMTDQKIKQEQFQLNQFKSILKSPQNSTKKQEVQKNNLQQIEEQKIQEDENFTTNQSLLGQQEKIKEFSDNNNDLSQKQSQNQEYNQFGLQSEKQNPSNLPPEIKKLLSQQNTASDWSGKRSETAVIKSEFPQKKTQTEEKQRAYSVLNTNNDKTIDPQFIKMLKDTVAQKNNKNDDDFYRSVDQRNNQSVNISRNPTIVVNNSSNNSQNLTIKKKQQLDNIKKKKLNKDAPLLQHNIDHHLNNGTCKVQMLRSACLWSVGINEPENSIHMAYIAMIGQAKHFIYIENQFFMSSVAGAPLENQVALALVTRIKQAYDKQEKFKVVVVMPLLPAFAGEVDSQDSSIMKIQLYWEFKTISRGGNSIYEQLVNYGIEDPMEYIQFYGLRAHGKNKLGEPFTEQVYIHSKLIIVDDQKVLMGSANINDRSLLGNRDSEIAMLVEDQEIINIPMDGTPYKAKKFAHTLRLSIFQEHFGLSEQELQDPLDFKIGQKIQTQTKNNAEIYRNIFRCYPDDNVTTFKELQKFKQQAQLNEYDNLKDQIIGFAVPFPIDFLKNESLRFSTFQKENIFIPENSFT